MSQTVRTAILWQVWVPVGSSSSATRMGRGGDCWRRVRMEARSLPGQIGGRLERVVSSPRGLGSFILAGDVPIAMVNSESKSIHTSRGPLSADIPCGGHEQSCQVIQQISQRPLRSLTDNCFAYHSLGKSATPRDQPGRKSDRRAFTRHPLPPQNEERINVCATYLRLTSPENFRWLRAGSCVLAVHYIAGQRYRAAASD